MFRISDADNYYRFSWDQQRSYRRLVKVVNGTVTELAADNVPFVNGQTYQVRIVANGTQLQVWIDGALIFQVSDSAHAAGTIAFYSWGMQGGYFDALRVSVPEVTPRLLSTDFTSPSLTGWSYRDEGSIDAPSDWRVVNGELAQLSNIYGGNTDPAALPKPGTYLVYDPGLAWGDVRLQFQMRAEDDDALGALLRFRDDDNYYRFSWDRQRGYQRLVKKAGGVFTLLAENSVAHQMGRNYAVELLAQGNQLAVTIDGNTVLEALDSSHTTGTVGFYTWGMQGAFFDDVAVSGP